MITIRCCVCGACCLLLLVFVAMGNALAQGQVPAQPQAADLKPGDKVEYLDGRGLKKTGEFVENAGTSVKIKLEDGTTRLFNPNRVRAATGAAPQPTNRPLARPGEKPGEKPDNQPAAAPGKPNTDPLTWTDTTGTFKIEAAFVALEKGQVRLKKADGKIISVLLEKLSAKDQAIAQTLAAAWKAYQAAEADRPAAVADLPKVAAPGDETKITLQDVPAIKLEPASGWAVPLDPARSPAPKIADKLSPLPRRPVVNAQGRSDDGRGGPMVVDAARAWLWIGINHLDWRENTGRLERIDLVGGKLLPPLGMPFSVKPLGIDPTGRYLATSRAKDTYLENAHLDLWEIEGNDLRPTKNFRPFGSEATLKHFSWLEFVDSSHLFTLGANGKLVLWDTNSLQAVYQLSINTWSRPLALSPGRRHLAVGTPNGVYVLEALTGRVLGFQEIKRDLQPDIHCVAFSDDGSQLAAVSGAEFWIWNVADGKLVKNFAETLMSVNNGTSLTFGSHNHLIMDHSRAFDIERGRMSFQLSNGHLGAAATFAGREIFLTEDRNGNTIHRGLLSLAFPGDDIATKAATYTDEQLLVIKPGSTIALDYGSLPFDAAQIAKMRAAIKFNFENKGWRLANEGEAADLVLTGTVTEGEAKAIEYQSFIGAVQKATFRELKGELVLKAAAGGEPVWRTAITWSPPNRVVLKEGQTLQDAIRSLPNPGFFSSPGIWRRQMKYPQEHSILVGTLTSAGMTVK